MSLAEKKQSLLHIIEEADEKLTGLLIALATEYNDADDEYSKQELDFFNDRRKAFYDNNKAGSSTEEVHEKVRRNYRNGV
jgi:hypothetical protein